MRQLPDRPDMSQLRRQARELLRAAAGGDPDATNRLAAVSERPPTLSAAQLALAREHGFPSWARLKAEVVQRRAGSELDDTSGYVIRPVASLDELARAFDVVGAQVSPRLTREDRRFVDLARCFDSDRSMMLVVERRGRIAGGAFAFGSTVRIVGLEPRARGKGLGRRLMEAIEVAAIRLGRSDLYLGAAGEVRSFYARLGYSGRGSRMHKGLPLRGRTLAARLRSGHWRQHPL